MIGSDIVAADATSAQQYFLGSKSMGTETSCTADYTTKTCPTYANTACCNNAERIEYLFSILK